MTGKRGKRITYHNVTETGEQITTTVLVMTPKQWDKAPESGSPLWSKVTIGKLVIALAVDIIDNTAPIVQPRSPGPVYVPSLN